MEQKRKIFANGLMFKRRREGAPEFIKGHVSVKVDEFTAFLKAHQDAKGWVNLDLKLSQGDKLYFELDQWKPKAPVPANDREGIDPSSVPF